MPEPAESERREYRKSGFYIKAKPGLVVRDRRVRRLAEKVRAACPWLKDSDTPAIRVYCEIEILTSQVYAVLRGYGVLNAQGEARRLLHDYRQMRALQIVYANALGLTPQARQSLAELTRQKPVLDLEAFRAGVDSDASEPPNNASVEIRPPTRQGAPLRNGGPILNGNGDGE